MYIIKKIFFRIFPWIKLYIVNKKIEKQINLLLNDTKNNIRLRTVSDEEFLKEIENIKAVKRNLEYKSIGIFIILSIFMLIISFFTFFIENTKLLILIISILSMICSSIFSLLLRTRQIYYPEKDHNHCDNARIIKINNLTNTIRGNYCETLLEILIDIVFIVQWFLILFLILGEKIIKTC